MSEQAREANAELYDALWQTFVGRIEQQRTIDCLLGGTIDDFKAMLAENEDMALHQRRSRR